MKLTVLAVVLSAGLVSAQLHIDGGHVTHSFTSCGAVATGCGANALCCSFQHTYNNFTMDFCMDQSQTQGQLTGTYQDQENYPFAIYNWNCGSRMAMGSGGYVDGGYYPYGYNGGYAVDPMYMGNGFYEDIAGLPAELINNGNWFWTWTILMSYIGSGSWLLGYVLFLPMSAIMQIYNIVATLYGFFIMLFENPKRLSFQEWVFYPLRRQFVQWLCQLLGSILILFPIVSAFGMPVLGALAINDYLDYQGWNQVGYTLSLPFMGYNDGYQVMAANTYNPNWQYQESVIVA